MIPVVTFLISPSNLAPNRSDCTSTFVAGLVPATSIFVFDALAVPVNLPYLPLRLPPMDLVFDSVTIFGDPIAAA